MEVHVHDELTGGDPRRRPARGLSLAARSLVVCLGICAPAPALAITLNVTHSGPSVVGEAHAFTASVPDAIGAVSYEWQFSEADDFQPGGAAMSHTYTAPGLYSVQVNATDSTGDTASVFFRHLVHYPLTATATDVVHVDRLRQRPEPHLLRQPGQRHGHGDRSGQARRRSASSASTGSPSHWR